MVPYSYQAFWETEKRESDGLAVSEHPWALILGDLVPRRREAGISDQVIGKMLVENPKKVLAF